jgi:hypothetical protein
MLKTMNSDTTKSLFGNLVTSSERSEESLFAFYSKYSLADFISACTVSASAACVLPWRRPRQRA